MKNQDTNWMQIFPLYIPGKKTKKQKLVQLREKNLTHLYKDQNKQITLPQTQDMNRHFTKEDRMQGQYES